MQCKGKADTCSVGESLRHGVRESLIHCVRKRLIQQCEGKAEALCVRKVDTTV